MRPGPKEPADTQGNLLQELVARFMAQSVIDQLKVIQIQKQRSATGRLITSGPEPALVLDALGKSVGLVAP